MLHSTTSTGSFDIVKYSRSYPPPSIAGSESQASQRTPAPQPDWQHFFNPLMRLVLDIIKSERGELESVRLRILWYMDGGPAPANDAMDIDQRDPVVFEDLDLLSFSSLPSLGATMHGPPLRAAYRDSVVMIRYLYRRDSATPASAFRRFQINFQSPDAASQFIDGIRVVCPCKENGAPALTLAPARNLNPTMSLAPKLRAIAPRTTALLRGPSTDTQPDHAPSSSSSGLSVASFGFGRDPASRFSSLPLDSSSQLSSAFPSPNPLARTNSTLRFNSGATVPLVSEVGRNKARDISSLVQGMHPSSSLPPSSPPSSSAPGHDASMPPPPVPVASSDSRERVSTEPQADVSETQRSLFLSSLRETSELYKLSRSELESLVNDVIRQPGFAQLLENLDTLWVAKGFVNH